MDVVTKSDLVVAVFNADRDAKRAVLELQKTGYDMEKLSIVVRDNHAEEPIANYNNTGDRAGYPEKLGPLWGGFWGMLFGPRIFFVPEIGPIVVGGPLASWIAGALEGAAVGGGSNVVGAAFHNIGVPKDSVLAYERNLKANRFLVIAHGTTDELDQAGDVLRTSGSVETNEHMNMDELILRSVNRELGRVS